MQLARVIGNVVVTRKDPRADITALRDLSLVLKGGDVLTRASKAQASER